MATIIAQVDPQLRYWGLFNGHEVDNRTKLPIIYRVFCANSKVTNNSCKVLTNTKRNGL